MRTPNLQPKAQVTTWTCNWHLKWWGAVLWNQPFFCRGFTNSSQCPSSKTLGCSRELENRLVLENPNIWGTGVFCKEGVIVLLHTESDSNQFLRFLKNCCTIFRSSCTVVHSHQQYKRSQVLHILTNTCCSLFFFFLKVAILMGVRWQRKSNFYL